MKRTDGRGLRLWIFAGSVVAHVAFFGIIALLPSQERSKVVTIDFADLKRPKDAAKPPRDTPTPPKEARPKIASIRTTPPARPKAAAEPAKPAAPTSQPGADGFADLGAIPVGGGGKGAAARGPSPSGAAEAPKATAHRVRQLAAPPRGECTEAVVKPKVKTPGQITYTKEGQEAEIEGPVKIQVTVDEEGKVIAATVVGGLGFGLDERALAAAKETIFEPATACGKPVVATKILVFTFELR